jgi:hypothetical protein
MVLIGAHLRCTAREAETGKTPTSNVAKSAGNSPQLVRSAAIAAKSQVAALQHLFDLIAQNDHIYVAASSNFLVYSAA